MPGAWALGDCAAVPNAAAAGALDPATCQHALRQARRLARNLRGAPRPYRYRTRGQMATLGRRHGIAVVAGLPVRGLPGWLIARGYHLARPALHLAPRPRAGGLDRRRRSSAATSLSWRLPTPALIPKETRCSPRPIRRWRRSTPPTSAAATRRSATSGLLWRDRGEASFRAAWVQGTGEVYLFRYAQIDGSGGTVDVLDRRFTLREILRAFAGYRDVCGRPGSLLWFLDRADGTSALRVAA